MDGHFVPWDKATLHATSHGLNYATSVFEGIRVYAGRPFKLTEHVERFRGSADLLGFPLPYGTQELCDAVTGVISVQELRNGYVRPVAWRGHESISIAGPDTTPHVVIAAMSMGDVFDDDRRRTGLRLQVSRWSKPDPDMAPVKAKAACHYVIAHLAIKEARSAGFDDALMLDGQGNIAESTGSNFFVVKDGELITPVPESALDGITRRTVMGLARERGVPVREEILRLKDLVGAQESFLTGTAYEVVPVRSVGSLIFPGPRPITEALTKAYFDLVGKEVA